jgi:hypothetical protein
MLPRELRRSLNEQACAMARGNNIKRLEKVFSLEIAELMRMCSQNNLDNSQKTA